MAKDAAAPHPCLPRRVAPASESREKVQNQGRACLRMRWHVIKLKRGADTQGAGLARGKAIGGSGGDGLGPGRLVGRRAAGPRRLLASHGPARGPKRRPMSPPRRGMMPPLGRRLGIAPRSAPPPRLGGRICRHGRTYNFYTFWTWNTVENPERRWPLLPRAAVRQCAAAGARRAEPAAAQFTAWPLSDRPGPSLTDLARQPV
jgi:hypothetical protein